jgi:hypothetical protein
MRVPGLCPLALLVKVYLMLILMIFKNSVRTSKKTPHFTITKINWFLL